MLRWFSFGGLVAMLCAGAFAHSQGEAPKPGKLTKEEEAALQPGLTLRFYDGDAKTPSDARRVRMPTLHVPAGDPPTPFLAAKPFRAEFVGHLKAKFKGEQTFRVVGNGAVALRVNGKELLAVALDDQKPEATATVDLVKGYNLLQLDVRSPAKGDTAVRLYWTDEKIGFEPVPPDLLFSRNDEAILLNGEQKREGRLLFATHGCARCHALPGGMDRDKMAMPELKMEGPSLEDAGQRLSADWLAAWIANPRALRIEATMPHVLHGPDAPDQAADLSAYVATLKNSKAIEPAKEGDAVNGAERFDKLGCVACHHFGEASKEEPLGRLSLHFAKAKYSAAGLVTFLRSPHAHYPWTRMPDFKLKADEAADLAAYITAQAKGTVAMPEKGDAERGKKRFSDAACANCHRSTSDIAKDLPTLAKRVAPTKFDLGCLAAKPEQRGDAPDFALKDAQRKALVAFLDQGTESLTREVPAEFAQRQMQALQCVSCHRRDTDVSRWFLVNEEDGKMTEILPSLKWTGQKLRPDWTAKMLAGQIDQRARPWLKARMPAFPARAEMLAHGLSHEHGYGMKEDPRPAPDEKLAEIGRKLVPQMGGFHCNNCHGIGKTPAIAPFEAPGVNLLDAALRLRHEYYARYMLDPSKVDVVLRMPTFAVDGRTTPLRDVLDGDARRQYEALWQYIQTLPATKSR